MASSLFLILLSLLYQAHLDEALDCSFQASYPRHHVTYRLGEEEEITLDGNMDEEAWQQVEWSEDFTDIRFDHMKTVENDII